MTIRTRSANIGGAIITSTGITFSEGVDLTTQANDAYIQANTARNQANAAYVQANTGTTVAQNAYDQANTAYGQANLAYDQANTGTTIAQGAYGQANTGTTIAQSAYEQANVAYGQANNAYAQANAGYIQANAAYNQANTATAIAQNAYNQANTARSDANTTFGIINNTFTATNTSITTLNNTANTTNATFGIINTTFGSVNTAITNAHNQANSARADANATFAVINTTFATLNTSASTQNTAITNAHNQANAAYAEANLKLNITGGTINGSLNVSGNLTITGNTKYTNVDTYIVSDPLIYLAANNDTSDIVDIGFMGGHNTAGVYSHSGLVRDAGDGTWYLFTGLAEEGHENNVVDFANTTLATLRANINANSILLTGSPVATQANLTLAHNQANTAYGQANAAYAQANTGTTIAQNAYGQANTARNQANTAYGQANSAYDAANNRVLKSGDTMTGALTSSGFTATQATAFYGLIIDRTGASPSTGSIYNGGNLLSFSYNGTAITFNTGGTPSEKVRITSAGLVGIGTTSPSTALQVNGTTTTTGLTVSNTINGSINGNAATASNASLLNNISAVNLYNNMGEGHSTRTSFDATTPSYGFGYRFVVGNTNGPGTGGTQYYSWYIGLGSDYGATGAGSYGAMFAVERNFTGPYLSVRYNENNSFGSWQKISAGNSDLLDGLSSATTATANTIVARDASGDDYRRYGFAQYFNMSHGTGTNVADTIFYSSTDDYIRKNNATGMRASLNVPTRTGGDASGTWGISITGNAGTVSNGMYLNSSQTSTVRKAFAGSQNVGSLQNSGGGLGGLEAISNSNGDAAFMSFHRPGNFASYFGIDTDNQFAVGGWSAGAALASFKCNSLGVGGAASGTAGVISGSGKVAIETADTYLRINQSSTFTSGIWYGSSNRLGSSGYIAAGSNGGTTTSRVWIQGGTYNGTNVIYLDGSNGNIYGAGSFGLGTAPSGTAGEIRATNNITAYYSDARLKNFKGKINNALDKVSQLNGYYYVENEVAEQYGYNNKEEQVGVSAQEVEAVLPHIVTRAPFDIAKAEDGTEYSKSGEDYKTVRYERLVPLLIEAIKELKSEIEELKKR